LYTQCSKCETVFKLSAEVLRAAGGQVRCGKCGDLFNALSRLAEQPTAFAGGETPFELEARADSILESADSLQVVRAVAKGQEEYVPPGVEIAELEFIDTDAEDADSGIEAVDIDRSMEFTLPPGELDRIFIESKRPAKRRPPPESRPSPESGAGAGTAKDAAPDATPDATPHAAPAEPRPDAPRTRARISGLEVPDDVRREMLAGLEEEEDLEPAVAVHFMKGRRHAPVPRRVFLSWLGAAIVLALLLLTQVVHQNREWSVARILHGLLGAPASAPANLSAYQLRQWGVTGDPDANGTLRLRASIMNTAAQLQPYPLLRVTLADRFGKKIGARDFEPGEYLGKPTARLLAPGERADATLEILDPGKNAEGFEVDVCLRGAEQRIACANDVAPQSKR
jgi:predicted Zn finger-like uncharacterized protein